MAIVRTMQRDSDSKQLIEMAVAGACAIYDCEYVLAARRMGVNLVTEDKQVLRHFADVAVSIQEFLDAVKRS